MNDYVFVLLYGNADLEVEQYCDVYRSSSSALTEARNSLHDLMEECYHEEEGYQISECERDDGHLVRLHKEDTDYEWFRIQEVDVK